MDEQKLHELVGQLLGDLGGAWSVPLVRIGEQFGLYKHLSAHGPTDSQTMAEACGLAERYLREWLSHQTASGYISYNADDQTFYMTAEQSMVFANEASPVYLAPAFDTAAALIDNQSLVAEAFKTGEGVGWGHQSQCLFCAVANFFKPGYQSHIVQAWLPSLDGVVERLQSGIDVADVGCGHGISTIVMAQAFPNSSFVGLDFHDGSVAAANQHAKEHGLSNVRFEQAMAKNFKGNYDFVTMFDCLHDMGDPVGAMTHIKQALNPGGSAMVVEPIAGKSLQDNLNPVGRLFYAASTMVCIPTSLAQEVGAALGAQAGEDKLREVIVDQAGFTSCRRATETPFNMILEAKK